MKTDMIVQIVTLVCCLIILGMLVYQLAKSKITTQIPLTMRMSDLPSSLQQKPTTDVKHDDTTSPAVATNAAVATNEAVNTMFTMLFGGGNNNPNTTTTAAPSATATAVQIEETEEPSEAKSTTATTTTTTPTTAIKDQMD